MRPVEAISFSSLRMAKAAMCQILGGGIFRDAITLTSILISYSMFYVPSTQSRLLDSTSPCQIWETG